MLPYLYTDYIFREPISHNTSMAATKRKRISSNKEIEELKQAILQRTEILKKNEEKKIEQREIFLKEMRRRNDLFERFLIQKQ